MIFLLVPEEPRKGKSVLNSYEYTTAIEIDGMNAEKIRHNIASGGELVILQEEGKQYEFKSVEKYMLYMRPVPKDYEDRWKKWSDDYKQEYRQLRQMFELNFIKKDEPKEARGKHIWTNYYTVPHHTSVSIGGFIFDFHTRDFPCYVIDNRFALDLGRKQLHNRLHAIKDSLRSFGFDNYLFGGYCQLVAFVPYF